MRKIFLLLALIFLLPSSICSAISTSISNLSVETFIERCNSNFVNASVPDFQIKIDKITEIESEKSKALKEFLPGGKFGKHSDQFYDERYQYYIGQGMDKDTAMRLAREEGTMYKYMKIQAMREATALIIPNGHIDTTEQMAWIARLADEDPWRTIYSRQSKRSNQ